MIDDSWAVIGDVHGDLPRLQAIFASPQLAPRRVVMVGDYVDRGSASAAVVAQLAVEKQRRGDGLVLLMGNHEVALLDYLDHGDLVAYAAHGGMATIRSYVGVATDDVHVQFQRAFPEAHERLLRELQSHLETDDILISHAGYDPSDPASRTEQALVLGSHPRLFDDRTAICSKPRPLVICGHYVQRSGRPYDHGGFVCLDTGCGTVGGPLTALLLPEHVFLVV